MKKNLAINSLYNIVYKLVTALYPLVAVTYVSHVLKSNNMGKVSYAQNIASYFVVFAAMGIPTYGTREVAKCSENKVERSKLFYELFVINSISTLIAVIAFVFIVFLVPKFSVQYVLYLVAGLQILLNVINVDWFYQGMEEYKYISIRSIIVKILALIALPIFVRDSGDYIQYALIYCLAIAGNNIFNIIRIRKYVGRCFTGLRIQKHVKPIVILLIASLAVEVYVMIDTTMLGFFCDDSTVGCYSNAMKLTRTVNTLAAAIGGVLLPRLSTVFANDDKEKFNQLVNVGIKAMLVVAIPSTVGLMLLGDKIVFELFGETFAGAIPILRILALMIPIVVCNTLMGGQVLITTNMEAKYVLSVMVASIVNVMLNALLIPHYGPTSAAVASLISECIDLALYFYFSRKYVRIHIGIRYVISVCFPLIVYSLLYIFVLNKMQLQNWLYLAICIAVCVVIYFSIGLLLKNESMLLFAQKGKEIIKKKLKIE